MALAVAHPLQYPIAAIVQLLIKSKLLTRAHSTKVLPRMQLVIERNRIVHLGVLIGASAAIAELLQYYFEFQGLAAYGFAVTVVCQINSAILSAKERAAAEEKAAAKAAKAEEKAAAKEKKKKR